MRFKQTLVMLLILAVAVGVAVFLEKRVPTTEEREEVKDRVLALKSDDIVEMTFLREGEEPITVVKKSEDEWRLTSPLEYKAERSSCTAVCSTLEFLRNEGVYPQEGQAFKPEDYGLDAPRLRLAVKTADGGSVTLLVGSEITPGNKMYVGVERDGALEERAYVTSSYSFGTLNKSVDDMRDKSVLDLGEEEVTRLRIVRPGEDAVEVARVGEGEGWEIRSPVADDADAKKVDSIVRTARYLRALSFVADSPEDLAQYGLDAPRLTLTLWQGEGGGSKTLLLGGEGEEKGQQVLYAMREGLDTVFAVRKGVLADFSVKPADLRFKKLGRLDRLNASRITLARGEEKLVLEKDAQTSEWRLVSPDLGKADMGQISRIYDTIENTQVETFIDSPADLASLGLEPPRFLVTVETAEGRSWSFAFGASDGEGHVWCRRDARDSVMSVDESVLASFPADALALKDRLVLSFAKADVEELVLTGPYGTWRVVKDGSTWKAAESPEGAQLDTGAVDTTLWDLSYLRCDRYVELGAEDLSPYGLDEPVATALVRLKGGEEKKLLLGTEQSGKVYALVAGTSDVVELDAGRMDRVLRGLGKPVPSPTPEAGEEAGEPGSLAPSPAEEMTPPPPPPTGE